MIYRRSKSTIPLPRDLLLRSRFVLAIIGDNIIQEFEEIFQTLEFPIFLFVEVLKLVFVFLRKGGLETCEGVIGGSITKWATLYREESSACYSGNN